MTKNHSPKPLACRHRDLFGLCEAKRTVSSQHAEHAGIPGLVAGPCSAFTAPDTFGRCLGANRWTESPPHSASGQTRLGRCVRNRYLGRCG